MTRTYFGDSQFPDDKDRDAHRKFGLPATQRFIEFSRRKSFKLYKNSLAWLTAGIRSEKWVVGEFVVVRTSYSVLTQPRY